LKNSLIGVPREESPLAARSRSRQNKVYSPDSNRGEARRRKEEDMPSDDFQMMNYEKNRPNDLLMIEEVKSSIQPIDHTMKRSIFQLFQKNPTHTPLCLCSTSIHLDMPRYFLNKKGVMWIIDIKQELFYQLEVTKQENTFLINSKYSICSFAEIVQEIIGPNTSGFLMIYSVPLVHSLEAVVDPKRKQQSFVRFINTRNPYTYNMKDIFTDISVFIGQIAKEVEDDFPFRLNQAQQEYLNFLPKSLKNLILYSPLLMELMKHKIELEINCNLMQRREILFVFLMAMEKDSLSEEVVLTMMDELLELINNILNNLVSKGSKSKGGKSYFGNFFFDKNVLVLTQNTAMIKKKKQEATSQEQIARNNDYISRKMMNKRLTSRKIMTSPSNIQASMKKLGSSKGARPIEGKNTVSALLRGNPSPHQRQPSASPDKTEVA
jgi:hypothetical protein